MDQIMRLEKPSLMGVSNPAKIEMSPGGAALNSASIAAALGLDTSLVSPVGGDLYGEHLVSVCKDRRIEPRLVSDVQFPTGIYSAIFEPSGEIVIGASDLGIYDTIDDEWLNKNLPQCDGLFLTSNLREEQLLKAVSKAIFIAAATISPAKAKRLKPVLSQLDILFTNLGEARALSDLADADALVLADWFIAQGVKSGTLSNGGNDLIYWHNEKIGQSQVSRPVSLADVNGAGDALAGAVLAGLGTGLEFSEAVKLGLAAAAFSLSHSGPFSALLTHDILKAHHE
ncbi:MAG: PfkB family carbohydrate kinase [Salaquimonas sp.]